MKVLLVLLSGLAAVQAQAATYCRNPGHDSTVWVANEWGEAVPSAWHETKQNAVITLVTPELELPATPVVFTTHQHSTRCGGYSSSSAEIEGQVKLNFSSKSFDMCGPGGSETQTLTVFPGTAAEKQYELQCQGEQ
jgi:hypothetical protein